MAARKINATKKEIVQVATRMFLEKGFTNTSVKSISDELGISTGNLTFHYPTKEHLLALLVEMLCDFQWHIMQVAQKEGNSQLLSFCLELPAIAATCEENPIAKDFYLSAYTYPMALDIIRRNDALKSQKVFGEYCLTWSENDFVEAENLMSGIEYAVLMTTDCSNPLPVRVKSALMAILRIYGVPEPLRSQTVQEVLTLDYRRIGKQVLDEFIQFVHDLTEEQVVDYLRRRSYLE